MWEHFTTKPLVDNGTFRRIEDCLTPWPCFVIAVRNEILEQHPEAIAYILKVINKQTGSFKNIKNIDSTLAIRYEQKFTDIQKWLKITEWNSGKPITKDLITSIQKQLFRFNVIKEIKNSAAFIKNM